VEQRHGVTFGKPGGNCCTPVLLAWEGGCRFNPAYQSAILRASILLTTHNEPRPSSRRDEKMVVIGASVILRVKNNAEMVIKPFGVHHPSLGSSPDRLRWTAAMFLQEQTLRANLNTLVSTSVEHRAVCARSQEIVMPRQRPQR